MPTEQPKHPHTNPSNSERAKFAMENGVIDLDPGLIKLILDLGDQFEEVHANAHEHNECNLDSLGIEVGQAMMLAISGSFLVTKKPSAENQEAINMLYSFLIAGLIIAYSNLSGAFGRPSVNTIEHLKKLNNITPTLAARHVLSKKG